MPHSNKVCEDNTAFLENRIKHLEAENLRLTEQHEVVRKAYVLACQTAERYREALERIANRHFIEGKTGDPLYMLEICQEDAQDALAESDSEKPVITDFRHSDTCWCTKPGEGAKA